MNPVVTVVCGASDPAARAWEPEQIVEHAGVLAPGFRAVVEDHLEFGAPVVIEGDHLLPDVAAGLAGVRTVLVSEPDEDHIVANLLSREPAAGEQRVRAWVSALHGARLAGIAAREGVPVVRSRPFDDVVGRVESALRASS